MMRYCSSLRYADELTTGTGAGIGAGLECALVGCGGEVMGLGVGIEAGTAV
jgi:hypothetical protein